MSRVWVLVCVFGALGGPKQVLVRLDSLAGHVFAHISGVAAHDAREPSFGLELRGRVGVPTALPAAVLLALRPRVRFPLNL